MPDPTRAVIYVRISKDRDEETSTSTQERACRQYAELRSWTVVGVEIDRGRSAYKGTSRAALNRAMRLTQDGAADVLLVWKLDRFVRSVTEFGKLWPKLRDAGAEFASVTDQFDTTTAMGRAMLQIAVVFAELESAIKGERISVWHEERRRTRKSPVGPRPFGYRRIDGGLEPIDSEAEELTRATEAILAGASLSSIVRDFNERHVPTAGTSDTWGLPTLRKVLCAPTTGGYLEIDGALIRGSWLPAVDPAAWQQVRTLLTDPNRRTSPGNQRTHLLTGGTMICGECGESFRARFAKTWTQARYVCKGCSQSVPLATADHIVTTAVLAFLDSAAWAKLRKAQRAPTLDAEALDDELAQLAELYAGGDLSLTEWRVMRQGITDRLAAARRQPAELPAVDDLHASWDSLGIEARLLVIDAVIESVIVNRGRALGPHFDTERIQIEWRV